MKLDKILIGQRIKNVREEIFGETREKFSERCGLTISHIGQIERGEILVSLNALTKICYITGTDINYVLYGKSDNLSIRHNINFILDRSNKDELKMYFNCITSIKNYIKED